ncbi:hypothetical protein VOLCADRAFT_70927, partial [Volvox carteri f. nagariensis]
PLVMQPPAELASSSPPVHRVTSSHFLPTCHSSAAKCGNSGGGVASADAAAGGAGVLFSTCPSRHVESLPSHLSFECRQMRQQRRRRRLW